MYVLSPNQLDVLYVFGAHISSCCQLGSAQYWDFLGRPIGRVDTDPQHINAFSFGAEFPLLEAPPLLRSEIMPYL